MKDHRLATYQGQYFTGDKIWVWSGGVFKDLFPDIQKSHPGYSNMLAFRFVDPDHPHAAGHPLYPHYFAAEADQVRFLEPEYVVAGRTFKNIDRAIAHATKLAKTENRHVPVEIQGW